MPADDLIYFEDLKPGMSFELAPRRMEADEIVAFASEFDPQPMHLDEAAGKASILGGLSASGWHSCSVMMRLMCESHLLKMAAEGAPGVDYVKWKRPVLAGDTLSGRTTVGECRRSASRPAIGIVKMHHQLVNQRGELVLESENPLMVRLRNGAAQ